MNITLRAGERLYLNGAVIRVDRKTTIELLNDATFLLENHVMQANDATTPLRQIYFAVQIILMDPTAAQTAGALAEKLVEQSLAAFRTPAIVEALQSIRSLLARGRNFEALKTLRGLYALEQQEMFPNREASRSAA